MSTFLSLVPLALPPAFPASYYVGEQSQTVLNTGGYRQGSTSSFCCAAHSPNCRIQTVAAGEDYYEDAKNNRTRQDSAQGAIVKWYGIPSPQFPDEKDGMEMGIAPNPNTTAKHKYVCASYCPLQGAHFLSQILLGDEKHSGPMGIPKDMGAFNISLAPPFSSKTALTERWDWKEGLAAPKLHWQVVMSEEEFYVATVNRTVKVPWLHNTKIVPFNKYLGEVNVSFLSFTPMDVSEQFDIDPDSMKTCKPPKQGCSDDSLQSMIASFGGGTRNKANKHANSYLSKALEMAVEKGDTELLNVYASSRPRRGRRLSEHADVDTPLNYVSVESSTTRIAQRASVTAEGETCCDINQAGGCSIQYKNFEGTRYFDWENQRQRVDDTSANQTIVDDYDGGKSMLVENVSGVETCMSWCPITLQDDMEPLYLPKAAKYQGQASCPTGDCQHWHWTINILKFIPMQKYDFYAVNRSVPTDKGPNHTVYCIDNDKVCTVPVYSTMAFTPFGRMPPEGYTNTTWHSVKMELPPKEKFVVAGEETCPQSKGCGNSMWQMHRIGSKQWHTYYHHLEQH